MFPVQFRAIRCPNCQETIDSASSSCRFCNAQIDATKAAAEAALQDSVNGACSEAAYLQTTAAAMFGFLFLTWLQILYLFFWGFLVTFVLVPVLLIRWQLRYSRISTDDPDFKTAKRSRSIAIALWLTAAILTLAPILDGLVANRNR